MKDIGGEVGGFAERIAASFEMPLIAGNRQHRVRVSIGAAVFPSDGRTADELLSNSHLALSRAKATRRGGHVLFEESIRHELETRLTLKRSWRWRRNAMNSNFSTSHSCIWPMVA